MAQVQIPADLANQTLTFRIEVSDRANFQTSVSQSSVDASVRSNTSSNAGLLECLQDPSPTAHREAETAKAHRG